MSDMTEEQVEQQRELKKDFDEEDLKQLAKEVEAVRQGILISTASMLSIGMLQLEIYKKNPRGAVNRALDLAQHLINKVCNEKEDQKTKETPEHTD